MRPVLLVPVLLLLTFAIACTNPSDDEPAVPPALWTALRDADRYELLSIDPNGRRPPTKPATRPSADPDQLRGYAVLGRVAIVDPAVRVKLNDAFREAVRSHDNLASGCKFQPRRAIRVVTGDQSWDVLICFKCGDARAYDGTQPDDRRGTYFPISRVTPPIFNQTLVAAGVPLAEE